MVGRARYALGAVVLAAAVFGVVSAVQAAIPDGEGVVHACVSKQDQVLVHASGTCKAKKETPLNLALGGLSATRHAFFSLPVGQTRTLLSATGFDLVAECASSGNAVVRVVPAGGVLFVSRSASVPLEGAITSISTRTVMDTSTKDQASFNATSLGGDQFDGSVFGFAGPAAFGDCIFEGSGTAY